MTYIKLPSTYPYSSQQLRADNPDTSFPSHIPDERLADWGVFPVAPTPKPDTTLDTRVEEGAPALVGGVWQQVWDVITLTQAEIDANAAATLETVRAQRAEAYRAESDPLFFKWQRGEATQQQWLDKVAEIKSMYP